ncbi:MAG TPA: beta-galactosidase GalA [Candidatus Acidoferrales bacterium]|nr:beta-galactosidase GalA [Candidatus Acidoferrales bacterium]
MTSWTRRELLQIGAMAPAAGGLMAQDLTRSPLQNTEQSADREAPGSDKVRERLLLDFNWRFHFGNADDPEQDFHFGDWSAFAKTGEFFLPSRTDFDDSGWQAIRLPHDFAAGLPFVNDPDLADYGFKPIGRKYPATSIGWYRRVFEIPQSDHGRRLAIAFDGVFRDCMVGLNGNYLGRNLSGYAPFRYDITDFARYGDKNVLVVHVNATEHEGWFYEGAGIYRHVWLEKMNAVHVANGGTHVTSEVHGSGATIEIATEVANDSDAAAQIRATHEIFDASGDKVATIQAASDTCAPWGSSKMAQGAEINAAKLWSLENPHLYRAVTTIESAGTIVDRYETIFGIRTAHFDPDKGFFLNGERVEIKGMCNHQDHAGVGSALPDGLQYFRVAKLKEMGANAYRTSHNPPTPELLDACDRLGMLVMDETRMMSSSTEGLSQLERMIRRDRNHPSIILWSLGNEEPLQGTPTGARICATMKQAVREVDASRPVTLAMNNHWGQGASTVLDVQGCNYVHNGDMDKFHSHFPRQPIVGSEEASALSTRGIYSNDAVRGYMSSYDVNTPGHYAATAEEWWNYYSTRPFAAGAFVWTGFDYRGEPSPYKWPCINSHFGVMDTCGFPKDTYFYYQAWWSGRPVLHLFPHWNWQGQEGQPIQVWVHSNCDEVELFLNDASLGRKPMPRLSHLAWKVNYVPGVLMARGWKNGKVVSEDKRETTDAAAQIKLIPDRAGIRADAEDVAVVSVSVLDAQNRVIPIADDEITFETYGPGKIIGVGNGDPSSHEADKPPAELYDSHGAFIFGSATEQSAKVSVNAAQILTSRRVFNGFAQVIVQGQKQPGDIVLTAASPGLQSASITIHANTARLRPAVA